MFYRVVRLVIRWWARWYLRLEIVGQEHVPVSGGVLVAGNHVSYLDIPMLACALDRPADFMGKRELFRHPVVGWCYRRLGAIPIRRGGVTKDALAEAARRLQAGRVVVIYPEGKISETGDLLPPKLGIGLVVERAAVPVVPVYMRGTDVAMPRGRRWIWPRPVKVFIGPPLVFRRQAADPAGADLRLWYEEVGAGVMQAIEALRQQSLNDA
jgi:1-acyl-sn-glycerol-3-phosphate acyltransferase